MSKQFNFNNIEEAFGNVLYLSNDNPTTIQNHSQYSPALNSTNHGTNQTVYSPSSSLVGQNHTGNGIQQKYASSTSPPIKYQNSVRFEPGSSSYVGSNGSNNSEQF
ncbi:unnamed protein product [Schistosoma curassoni]|uniref:Uncharacterized protein n=1 Tax=Schistosoma curassoni TaxID=6186 RepID=A0A183JXX8_9TREM|nr:unnamed protein product [Schistosoma curassoni]